MKYYQLQLRSASVLQKLFRISVPLAIAGSSTKTICTINDSFLGNQMLCFILIILESEIHICCNALKHQYQLSISLQHQIFGQQSTSCINTVDILFLDQNRFFKEISIVLVYRNAIKGWIFREFSVIFFPGLSGIEQFARITKSHHIRVDVSSCDLDLFAVQCLGGFPAGGCCNNPEGKVYYSYHLRGLC